MRPRGRFLSEPLRSDEVRAFRAAPCDQTRRIRVPFLLAAVIFVFAAKNASAQDTSTSTPSVADSIASEVRGVFERAKKCVVRIEATDDHGHLSGTGFFVDPAGIIYTSYTIGGETSDIVVCSGHGKMPA